MKKRKFLLLFTMLLISSCNSNNSSAIYNASRSTDFAALRNIITVIQMKFAIDPCNYYTMEDKTFVINYSNPLFKLSYNEKNVITANEENLTNDNQQYTITETTLGKMIISICKEDIGEMPGTFTASLDEDGVMIVKYYYLLSGIGNDIAKFNFAISGFVE